MSLINKILGKLFSKEQPKAQPANHLNIWEKDRRKRIKAAEERLKPWIIEAIKEKGSLSFTWESGNDEGFVTFKDNTAADDSYFQDLEEYIIDVLDIPSAGEFQMNGSGDIYIYDNLVKVKYSSTMKDLTDYNEETDEEIYGENVEHDSDDRVLFAI